MRYLAFICLLLTLFAGCSPSARDLMQQAFSADPPVSMEYDLDGSRFYKTRNLVLDAHYSGNQLTSLVLVVALPLGQAGPDTIQGGILLFRGIASEQRFLAERSLLLTVGGRTHDLGPCAYQTGLLKGRGVVENLTAFVQTDLLNQIARADTIKGTIGPVSFILTAEELAPVRALVDTTRVR